MKINELESENKGNLEKNFFECILLKEPTPNEFYHEDQMR